MGRKDVKRTRWMNAKQETEAQDRKSRRKARRATREKAQQDALAWEELKALQDAKAKEIQREKEKREHYQAEKRREAKEREVLDKAMKRLTFEKHVETAAKLEILEEQQKADAAPVVPVRVESEGGFLTTLKGIIGRIKSAVTGS